MLPATITRPALHLARRWGGLGWRRRLALGMVAALLAIGGVRAYFWWIDWPPRLVLRSPGHTWPLAFSPDGATLATAGTDGITLWETARGRPRTTWDNPGDRAVYLGLFTPDGRTFADLSFGGPGTTLVVDLFNAGTGRLRGSVPTGFGGMLGLSVADGGRTIRAAVIGRTVTEIVDVAVDDGRLRSRRRLSAPPVTYASAALSGDGRTLALASRGPNGGPDEVLLWDVDEDRQRTRLPAAADRAPIEALALSPDAGTVALGRLDGSIELWSLTTRRREATPRGHRSPFVPIQLRFGPGGKTLVSLARLEFGRSPLSLRSLRAVAGLIAQGGRGEPPYEMILIALPSGRQSTLTEPEGRPTFTPDGLSLATARDDGSALIRDLPRN